MPSHRLSGLAQPSPASTRKNINQHSITLGSIVSSLLLATFPCVLSLIFHFLLFLFRLPLFLAVISAYSLILPWLPPGSVGKKACSWTLMGTLGIWWTDLQIDGVRRGYLGQQPRCRLPHPGSIITTYVTSPIDAIYLVAAFDPIFTVSHPWTLRVRRLTLLQAILHAFMPTKDSPGGAALTDLETLLARHPEQAIVVFLEYATTNSKGIAPDLSSLLSVPATAKVFPISIKYTPPDVTTQVSRAYLAFLWNLLSRPMHYIRVRISDDVTNTIVLSQSDKTSNNSVRLGVRYNGGGNRRRLGLRASESSRGAFKRPLSVLTVINEGEEL